MSCLEQPSLSKLNEFYYISEIMIAFKLFNRFSQYHYFREIADFLKIKVLETLLQVPPLNQQILITHDKRCTIHGLKLIQTPPLIQPQQTPTQLNHQSTQTVTSDPKITFAKQSSKNQQQPKQEYVFDQHAELMLPFGHALSAAKQLSLDLCLIKEQSNGRNPVLSVSSARKHIYEQFYKNYIKKRGKFSFKTVRLGQKINENDLRNKYHNLKRMFDEGERNFKLVGLNDSEKSQKVIIEFAKLFGKSVEPTLQSVKTKLKQKEEERWVATMIFQDQIAINPDQVNKKWRRRKLQSERQVQKQQQEESQQFQHEDAQVQKDIYEAYKQMGKKVPIRYRDLEQIERAFEGDKMALFKSADQQQQLAEFQWDEEEQKKYQENINKFNNQFFGRRTIEDILTEMEELKTSGYQSQAYKVARFRQLKSELEARIRRQGSKDL